MGKGIVQVTCLLIAVYGVCCVSADDCDGKADYTRLPFKSTPVGNDDCRKLAECHNGKSTFIDCPTNYYYDDGTKSCVLGKGDCTKLTGSSTQTCKSTKSYIPGADCNSYTPCTEDSLNPGTFIKGVSTPCTGTTPYLNPYGTNGPVCSDKQLWICKATSFLPNCATQPSGEFIGDLNSCTGYYICADGERVKRHCTKDLHFDPFSKSCVYEEDSKCNLAESSASSTLGDICKGKKGGFVADPKSCRAYYYCVSETLPSQIFCPTSRYFVNGYCVNSTPAPANCGCETVMDAITAPDDVVRVKAAKSNQYWKCSMTEAELKTCPTGTFYSEADESCE